MLYISLRPHQSAKFHEVLSGKWLFRRILLNRSSLLAFCVLGNEILSMNTTQIFYTLEWAIRLAMVTTVTCCSARRTSRPQRGESSDFVAEPSAKRQHLSLKLSKKKAQPAEPSNHFAVSVDEQTCERASERLKPATQRPALNWQLKPSPHRLEQLYYQRFLPLLSIPLHWVCVVLLATICFLLFLFCSPQLQYVCFLLLLYHQLIALSLCNCLMHFQGFCLQLIYWLPVLYISSLFTP